MDCPELHLLTVQRCERPQPKTPVGSTRRLGAGPSCLHRNLIKAHPQPTHRQLGQEFNPEAGGSGRWSVTGCPAGRWTPRPQALLALRGGGGCNTEGRYLKPQVSAKNTDAGKMTPWVREGEERRDMHPHKSHKIYCRGPRIENGPGSLSYVTIGAPPRSPLLSSHQGCH